MHTHGWTGTLSLSPPTRARDLPAGYGSGSFPNSRARVSIACAPCLLLTLLNVAPSRSRCGRRRLDRLACSSPVVRLWRACGYACIVMRRSYACATRARNLCACSHGVCDPLQLSAAFRAVAVTHARQLARLACSASCGRGARSRACAARQSCPLLTSSLRACARVAASAARVCCARS